jgi:hypothetical protein
LAGAGVAASAIVSVLAAAAFAGGGALGGRRPLGLVWDLICFLPRAAHPFGPPCYAERAVPELQDRCNEWLGGEDPPRDRVIVLSAHSLGAVLAVAVLFALPREAATRLRLLTYGVQLRAYFGRIFPELLGPAILGTSPCRAACLTGVDPLRHVLEPAAAPPGPESVVSHLTSRDGPVHWRNLWRRTDFLGFPVDRNPRRATPIDEAAEEMLEGETEVYTHGNYPRTDAYRNALLELTGLIRTPD